MACRIVTNICKTAGESKLIGFDYTDFLANYWKPGTIYASTETVRPTEATGFQYESSGGQSGSEEPTWPTTLGGTVTDGSITWTAEAVDNNSLRATIVTSSWAADTVTTSFEALVNTGGKQIVTAVVAGGTEGNRYEVTNTVTLSDHAVEESVARVRVSA